MKRKKSSIVIIIVIILSFSNQCVLASDYQDGTSDEFDWNFVRDLENHPDIDLNLRDYLNADFYQTKDFSGQNFIDGFDVVEDSNWELVASNILKLAYNRESFITDANIPLGNGEFVLDGIQDVDTDSEEQKLTSPNVKKIVAEGYFVPSITGEYSIGSNSNEGIRLTFDNDIYDTITINAESAEHSYAVGTLNAGMIYPIKIEYFENQIDGDDLNLFINGLTTEDIKGYFYPKLTEPVKYTLTILVEQVGSLENNKFVDYVEPHAFSEIVDFIQVDFMSDLYSEAIVIGKEYKVDVKHVDGYIYEISRKITELIPIADTDAFEEKISWVLFTKEADEFPSISGRLLSDESYAVNYVAFDYIKDFIILPISPRLTTTSPTDALVIHNNESLEIDGFSMEKIALTVMGILSVGLVIKKHK